MKENGWTEKEKDMENNNGPMVLCMKENGKMINLKEKLLKI